MKSWFNPNPTRFLENEDSEGKLIVDRIDVAIKLIEKSQEPETFEEAYYHSNPEDRIKWRDAISKELQEVVEKIYKSKLPNSHTCSKDKWVFKIKRNGIFRAQLVACGYSQVPGFDFQERE